MADRNIIPAPTPVTKAQEMQDTDGYNFRDIRKFFREVSDFFRFQRFGEPKPGLNYAEFENDGTLAFYGDATVWNDINKSLLPLSTGVGVPDIIAVNGDPYLRVRAFDGNTLTERVGESIEILHDYKQGSDIIPHVHWAPTTAAAGNVKWQLRYMWINRNDTFSSASTITVVSPSPGVAWQEVRVSLPTIDGTGKEIGSRFVFTLYRDPTDAADTYAADAAAFDFGIHYEIDTLGSRGVVTK